MSNEDSNPVIAKIQREEQAERARLEEHILAAGDVFNTALSGVVDAAVAQVEAKRDKLAALKARMNGLPTERATLGAEETQARRAFEAAVEDGEGLTTLTQDLMTINTKKTELEIMGDALERRLIPKAAQELQNAQKALEETVAQHLGSVLETKMAETLPYIEAINDELRGWCYAVNDALASIGLTNYQSVSQLRYKFNKKPA